jgi:hypothetical protein
MTKDAAVRDLGLRLDGVGVERSGKRLGVGNLVCDLAVVEVGSEACEAGFGQSVADLLHRVVETPPRVQHQHGAVRACIGHREIAVGLRK